MVKKTGLWLAVAIGSFAAGLALAHSSAQSRRELQIENTDVRVWKSVLLPHAPMPLHRHDHPRVILALNDGVMDIVQKGGVRETHRWKAGHAYWLPANAPGTEHQDLNVGQAPLDVMVVELENSK